MLPEVTQTYLLNAAAYLDGIDEMLDANEELAVSIDEIIDLTRDMGAEMAASMNAGLSGAVDAAAAADARLTEATEAVTGALDEQTEAIRMVQAELEIQTESIDAVVTAIGEQTTAIDDLVLALREQAAAAAEAAEANDAEAGSSAAAGAGIGSMKTALLAVAVAAAYSVDQAAKFQSAITMLNTQAGVSKSKLAALSQGVLQLAGQVGESPGNLADSLYHVESNMASLGISSQKALSMVQVAAEGARVGGADLVDVTNALTAAVASGIPGVQNYQQAMGALNATVGSGDMKMQDLADAMGTGMLAVVKGYGLSLTDVGAALATFGDNNIRGAKAGTDLRMAVQALSVPLTTAQSTLAGLGLTMTSLRTDMQNGGLMAALDDITGKFQKAGITAKEEGGYITTIFGKRAGTGVAILLEQMSRLQSKYPAIEKAAGDFGDAWQTTTQTLSQQWADLKSGLDALAISFGTALLPAVTKVVGMLARLGTFLEDNGWLAAFAGGILAIVAALKLFATVESIMQGAAAAVGLIGKAAAADVPEVTALDAAMDSNVLALVLVAVLALAVGLYELYQHFKIVRDAVADAGRAIADAFNAAMHAAGIVITWFADGPLAFIRQEIAQFKVWWAANLTEIEEVWHVVWDAIGVYLASIWAEITVSIAYVTAVWDMYWGVIRDVVTTAWNIIAEDVRGAITDIEDIITIFLALITGHWGKAWAAVENLTETMVSTLKDEIGTLGSGVEKTFTDLGGNILSGFKDVFHSASTAISSVVKDVAGAAGDSAATAGSSAAKKTGSAFLSAGTAAAQKTAAAWTAAGSTAAQAVGNAFTRAGTSAAQATASAFTRAGSTAATTSSNAFISAGAAASQKTASAWTTAGSTAGKRSAGAFAGAWDAVFGTLLSPVVREFDRIKQAISSGFDGWWKTHGSELEEVWSSTWEGITAVFTQQWHNFLGGADPLIGAFLAGWALFTATISAMWDLLWQQVTGAVDIAFAFIKMAVRLGWAAITGTFDIGIAAVKLVAKTGWDDITGTFDIGIAAVKLVAKIGWDIIVGIFSVALDLITGHWAQAWDDCKATATQVWNAITAFLGTSWDALKTLAIQTWQNILAFLETTWDTIKNNAILTFDQVRQFLITVWDDCYADVVHAWGTVVTWFKAVPGKIIAALGNLGSLLLGAGEAIIGGLIQGIEDSMGKLGGVVSGIAGFIKHLKGPLPKDLVLLTEEGQAIITGLINGIQSKQGDLGSAVAGIGTGIADVFADAMGISSPSKVFYEFALQITQGLIQGLEGTVSQVKAAAAKVAADLKDAYEDSDMSYATSSYYTKFVEADNSRLQKLATQRAALQATITTADKYAASVTSSAVSFASLSNLTSDQTTTAAGIAGGLATNLAQIRQFSKDLTALGKLGLNQTTLDQIIQAGPVTGDQMAQALLSGPRSYIGQINKTTSAISAAATQLGDSAADAMYDSGKDAGKGFLSGLEGQVSAINAVMKKIAANMVATIKNELKIHSPSQVMSDLGSYIALGLAQGIEGGKDRVGAAMTGLAGSLAGPAGSAGGPGGNTVINVSVSVPAGFIGSEQQLSQALFLVMQRVVLQNARRNTTNGLSLSAR